MQSTGSASASGTDAGVLRDFGEHRSPPQNRVALASATLRFFWPGFRALAAGPKNTIQYPVSIELGELHLAPAFKLMMSFIAMADLGKSVCQKFFENTNST